MTVRSFACYETIGIGIPNPRAVSRWVLPPGLTEEQLKRINAEIDRINAELEAGHDAPR
jgi:hypothetical protein